MKISHKHKYLFVELPKTATIAIGRELMENYAAEQILRKHSTYRDFLTIATPEEKEYFVFSCIRNPLQIATSRYMKLQSKQTNPEKTANLLQREGRQKNVSYYRQQKQFNFIHKNDASFDRFLRKFYKHPYDDCSQLDHHRFDFIIRFENIQADFRKVLCRMGIEPLRPLPVHHKTAAKKSTELDDYYKLEESREWAKKIFGIYMGKWNYSFPEHWGEPEISVLTKLHYTLANYVRMFYWRFWRNPG